MRSILEAMKLLKALERFQQLEPEGIKAPQEEIFNPDRQNPVDLSHYLGRAHREQGWRLRGHYVQEGGGTAANVLLDVPRSGEKPGDGMFGGRMLGHANVHWMGLRKPNHNLPGSPRELTYEQTMEPRYSPSIGSDMLWTSEERKAWEDLGNEGDEEFTSALASGDHEAIIRAADAKSQHQNSPEWRARRDAMSQHVLGLGSSRSGRAKIKGMERAADGYLRVGLKHLMDRFNPAVHGHIQMERQAPDEGRFPKLEVDAPRQLGPASSGKQMEMAFPEGGHRQLEID